MKRILLLFLMVISLAAVAQSGRIKGKVKTADQAPAAFVNVVLKGTSKGVNTDANGDYTIKGIQPGSYTLLISFIGLESKEVNIDVMSDQVTVVPDITLNEDSHKLDEIVVTGTRSYKEDELSSSLRLGEP